MMGILVTRKSRPILVEYLHILMPETSAFLTMKLLATIFRKHSMYLDIQL